MRVALFGGTGFVGSYLVDELLDRGHLPVLLTRPGSEEKVHRRESCATVPGDIDDPEAVRNTVAGADAVIYNIGILKEYPQRGVTFEALHFDGARRAVDAAVEAGVNRFLLMSANGVKPDGTGYQRTKYMAEQYLQASDLDWTIFRPSVLFGNPRGRMEFATQLYRDIVASPLPAPLFYPGLLPFGAGSMQMSPIHVRDVARAFVRSLESEESIGRIHPLGGPQQLSWKEILQTIAQATGKRLIGVPTPVWGVKTLAGMLQGLDVMPVTRDQLTMLMEGNSCDSSGLFRGMGIQPTPFDAKHLRYLTDNAADTSFQPRGVSHESS